MGGLATVAAAAIIAIVFLQAFSTYYSTSIQSSNLLLQSLNEQAQLIEESIHESLSLGNLTIVNSSTISFLATNTGTISIPATSFGEMDVFLQYSTNNSSSMTYDKLCYHPEILINDSWMVVSVTTITGGPEVLNPISLPSATTGQWDPSEVLHIVATLSQLDDLSNSSGVAIRMCMPAGVCSSVSA